MFIRTTQVLFACIFFCLAIILQTCSASMSGPGTESWVHFGDRVQEADPEIVNPDFEGEPVYLMGKLTTKFVSGDTTLNVLYKGLSLKRKAQVYQSREYFVSSNRTRNSTSGGTRSRMRSTVHNEANYEQVWGFELADHNAFEQPAGHENPTTVDRLDDAVFQAKEYTLGAYRIHGELYGMLETENAKLDEELTRMYLPRGYVGAFTDEGLYVYTSEESSKNPRIGDVRYQYTTSSQDVVSLIGGQSNDFIGSPHQNIRSTIMAGEHSLREIISYQTDGLEENSETSISSALLLVFISMLLLHAPLKSRLSSAPIWKLFINAHPLASAAVNTAWCYAGLYLISMYYQDFSQIIKITAVVFSAYLAFFILNVLLLGKKARLE